MLRKKRKCTLDAVTIKRLFKMIGISQGSASDQGYKIRILNYQIWVRNKKKLQRKQYLNLS